jgi:hypothetical protein
LRAPILASRQNTKKSHKPENLKKTDGKRRPLAGNDLSTTSKHQKKRSSENEKPQEKKTANDDLSQATI